MFPSHCVITEIHLITFQVDINYLLTDSHLKLGLNMKTSVDWHFEHVCLKTTTHHTSVSNPSDSAEQRREMYKFGLHTYTVHTKAWLTVEEPPGGKNVPFFMAAC